jgi:hypothetical protein
MLCMHFHTLGQGHSDQETGSVLFPAVKQLSGENLDLASFYVPCEINIVADAFRILIVICLAHNDLGQVDPTMGRNFLDIPP